MFLILPGRCWTCPRLYRLSNCVCSRLTTFRMCLVPVSSVYFALQCASQICRICSAGLSICVGLTRIPRDLRYFLFNCHSLVHVWCDRCIGVTMSFDTRALPLCTKGTRCLLCKLQAWLSELVFQYKFDMCAEFLYGTSRLESATCETL